MRDGKKHTRYVSEAELPALETALAGHVRHRQLTGQYADLIIAETRQNLAGLKKACPPEIRLAQEEEIQRLIASFQAEESLLIRRTGFGGQGK